MEISGNVNLLVEEYSAIFDQAVKESGSAGYNADKIAKLLVKHGEWSPSAAEHLVTLVNNYGSFMLRNALALSLVLGIEDGDFGF